MISITTCQAINNWEDSENLEGHKARWSKIFDNPFANASIQPLPCWHLLFENIQCASLAGLNDCVQDLRRYFRINLILPIVRCDAIK